jgi:hypothetical protein
MVYRSFRLIGKYALLLSVIYAFETIMWSVINMQPYFDELFKTAYIYYYIFYAVSIFFNIIIAVIINRDIKRLKLKTSYVILATLLIRPVGVCAFLLYSIIDEYSELASGKRSPGNKA